MEDEMGDTEMFDLSKRVALVTAGGRGLGREFCQGVAEFGADVACSDIDIGRARETVELIERFGHRAIAIQADASKEDHIEQLVNQTVAEFGTIDILFCNAGIPNPPLRIHELTIEDWDRVMDLNLRGTFLLMRGVLPIMLKNKKGSIIITSSVAGLMAGAEERSALNSAPYGASKHALVGLMKHAARAYANQGIRVNAIAPGGHLTWPLGVPKDFMEAMNNKIAKFTPMGRLGEPSEIRGLAVYLASDESSYVTGQVFVQDGGFTA
jgi:NAD(P)-dependent dehydrogenase (short-subunit alcohol dehydrogenase family)